MVKLVNIPALPVGCRRVTRGFLSERVLGYARGDAADRQCRRRCGASQTDSEWSRVQKNAPALTDGYPYRKPTQVGGHDKCAKVIERTLVKELGKTVAVPSV